jgi:hypothetical protein
MSIRHTFVSAKSDGGDATLVKPSDWNADHAAFPLDIAPTSPSTWDDEFNGTSLDGKWTAGFNSITTTVGNGLLQLQVNVINKHAYFIRQVAPTGSFTVTAKLAQVVPVKIDDSREGIFMARTASSVALTCGYDNSNNTQAMFIEHSNYSESADWAGYNGNYVSAGQQGLGLFYWYRMRWVTGSSTIFTDYSANGTIWYNFGSRTGQSQPDRVGIVVECNSGDAKLTQGMLVDWFRITEP